MTDQPQNPAESASGAPHEARKQMLVLGLGNDLLSDDAVGLNLVRELRQRFAADSRIAFQETGEMGLGLLDFVVGYSTLIVVDALQTGQALPGTVHQIEGGELKTIPAVAPHFLGLGEMLELGRTLGFAMPDRVQIFGIEVADPFTMSTEMTPALRRQFPAIADRIAAALRKLLGPL